MGGISVKAVIAGNVLSCLLILVLSTILAIGGIVARPAGIAIQDATSNLSSLPWFLFGIAALSVPSIAIAGYVAAKIATRSLLMNGTLASLLFFGDNVYLLLSHQSSRYDTLVISLVTWCSPLFALAGAYVRLMQVKRRR